MAAAHLKLLVYGEGRTSFDCCRYLPVPRIRARCRRQFPNPEYLRFMLPAKSGEKEIMVDYDDLCWQCCWAAALRLSPVARLLGHPSRRNRHPSPVVVRSMEYKIRIAPFVPRRWVRDPDSGPSPRPPPAAAPQSPGALDPTAQGSSAGHGAAPDGGGQWVVPRLGRRKLNVISRPTDVAAPTAPLLIDCHRPACLATPVSISISHLFCSPRHSPDTQPIMDVESLFGVKASTSCPSTPALILTRPPPSRARWSSSPEASIP